MQTTHAFAEFIADHAGCAFLPGFLRAFPRARVYLVGGAVRDMLLSRPCKDVDMVIAGVPRKKLETWFSKRGTIDLVGSRFGVYKFLPDGEDASPDASIDIALPRTEHVQAGSLGGYREFDVQADESLSIESDLSRRDFTINAMAYDVRAEILVDPFNGQRDVAQRHIRAVGEPTRRFHEDLSRLLRAIRFAVQLDFDIEPDTWRAIKQKITDLNLKRATTDGGTEYVVPRETIGRELAKALSAHAPQTIALLEKAGGLSILFPGTGKLLRGDYLNPLRTNHHALILTITLLLRDLPSEEVEDALHASGLPSLPTGSPLRVKEQDVIWMVARLQAGLERPGTLLPSEFERVFMNTRGVAYLDVLEALGQHDIVRDVRLRTKKFGRPKRLINGEDILALGVAAGPRVRELLDRVRDDQLQKIITSKREALDLLKQIV